MGDLIDSSDIWEKKRKETERKQAIKELSEKKVAACECESRRFMLREDGRVICSMCLSPMQMLLWGRLVRHRSDPTQNSLMVGAPSEDE